MTLVTIMQSEDDAGFDFNTLHGLGFPDWPAPNGGEVHGIADLLPGEHVVFDPFSARGYAFFTVTGEAADAPVPTADFEFTIGEMVINLPQEALTSAPALWHIENKGAQIHELAVLATPAKGFTFDDFMAMMMLPEDATPTPDMKVIEYQPVVAIGLLGRARNPGYTPRSRPGTTWRSACSPMTRECRTRCPGCTLSSISPES